MKSPKLVAARARQPYHFNVNIGLARDFGDSKAEQRF
jgi:hypothetical protein